MDRGTSPQKHDCSGSIAPTAEVLEKHKRYETAYGKNEIYWGLGIECESYLEMSKPVLVKADFMINNHTRERYSVDYFTSYKKDTFKKALAKFEAVKEDIPLPCLVNSHALTKMDYNLQHQTLYSKNNPPNPSFLGRTVFDVLKELQPEFFKDKHEKNFTFDGDSIEIMTQNFYKTTIDKVLSELIETKKDFIENLHAAFKNHTVLNKCTGVNWTSGNHGFAIMITNPSNLAIFNNGTYHINITLPTFLDAKGKIADWPKFVDIHKQYIRYVQWLEPILVANFGSPDPLAWLIDDSFALGSQRGAMSRYIGLGTYNTEKMERGKVLTVDLSDVKSSWYTTYHKSSGYVPLTKVGLDINFNKHWNHGVEIRFFDWFPQERLRGILKLLVYLGDLAMTRACKIDPLKDPIWNGWMVRVIQKGCAAGCTVKEAKILSDVLGIECKASESLERFFAELYRGFSKNYRCRGPCSKYFLSDVLDKDPECQEPVPVVEEVGVSCGCFPKQRKK